MSHYQNDLDAVRSTQAELSRLIKLCTREVPTTDPLREGSDAVHHRHYTQGISYAELQRIAFQKAGKPNRSRLYEQARDEIIALRDGYPVTTYEPKPESRENYREASERMADAVKVGGHAYQRGVELMGGRVERFVERYGNEDQPDDLVEQLARVLDVVLDHLVAELPPTPGVDRARHAGPGGKLRGVIALGRVLVARAQAGEPDTDGSAAALNRGGDGGALDRE